MFLKDDYRNYCRRLQIVHRKQLSSKVTKNAVSTPNQITAAEEYQDHENCPFKEKSVCRHRTATWQGQSNLCCFAVRNDNKQTKKTIIFVLEICI